MKDLLKTLLELQTIKFSDNQPADTAIRLATLRAMVPSQILGHFDRLVAHGKKGVAAVRRQTCMACHMNVPLGTVMALKRDEDIQLCGNCGRYLYLDETPEPVVEVPKKIKRRRKTVPLIPA